MINPLLSNDYYFPTFITTILLFLAINFRKIPLKITFGYFDLIVFILFMCGCVGTVMIETYNIYDFFLLICYLFTYLYAKIILTNWPEKFDILPSILSFVFFFEFILCILQLSDLQQSRNSFFKVTGSFITPAILTNFVCLSFPIISYWLKNNGWKFLNIAAFVMLIIICISTDSKLSWLVICVMLILEFDIHYLKYKRLLFYPSIIIVTTSVIYFIYLQKSTSSRFFILKTSVFLWFENFIYGVGIGKFEYAYNLFQSSYIESTAKKYPSLGAYVPVAYNEILQFCIETGIFGLVITIIIALFLYYNFKRYPKFLQNFVIILIIISLFSFPFHSVYTIVLIMLYSAAVTIYDTKTKTIYIKPIYVNICSLLLVMFLLFSSYQIQKSISFWSYLEKTHDKLNVNIVNNKTRPISNINDFQLSYAYILYKQGYYNESIHVLNKVRLKSSQMDIYTLLAMNYEKINDFGAAVYNYRLSSKLVPNLLKPKFLLMRLYLKEKKLDEAKKEANSIIRTPILIKNKQAEYILKTANKVLILKNAIVSEPVPEN